MDKQAASDQVVVSRPRECDAIGSALRNAYAGAVSIPEEMRGCLSALDRIPFRRD